MSKGSEINLYTESTNREDTEEMEVGIKFSGDFNIRAHDKIRNFFSKFGEVELNFKDNKMEEEKGFGYVYFKVPDHINKVFKQYGYRVKIDKETILTLEQTHRNKSLAMTLLDSSVT
ncbi:MAG: hypothetical protein EZS28_012173 [Streblomastix strix]|uniref:RRM domain-containing protein n=1 Tax=Streblomastix strix TaxID=222440 RepID=A0A5J4WBV7_9EUKA|nr:MAG: hypothetical protein EZS28_012173 [Streblomastix strix]